MLVHTHETVRRWIAGRTLVSRIPPVVDWDGDAPGHREGGILVPVIGIRLFPTVNSRTARVLGAHFVAGGAELRRFSFRRAASANFASASGASLPEPTYYTGSVCSCHTRRPRVGRWLYRHSLAHPGPSGAQRRRVLAAHLPPRPVKPEYAASEDKLLKNCSATAQDQHRLQDRVVLATRRS